MAFASIPFGDYTVSYGATPVGLTSGPITHSEIVSARPVTSSMYGSVSVDQIIDGGVVIVVIPLTEWTIGAKGILWPWDSNMGSLGQIGRSAAALAQTLTLTVVAGTRAASLGPAARTYSLAIPMPGQNTEIRFGTVQRVVPLTMLALPYQDSGKNYAFYGDA